MWHVECGDGIFFPFSRGCSFITLSQDGRKIQTVRAFFSFWLCPSFAAIRNSLAA
jgi:hypothetical protein